MPARTLEHPGPESGHDVLVEVGLFLNQLAYSLMLKMASERRDTNSEL